jgi:hypothetical protein
MFLKPSELFNEAETAPEAFNLKNDSSGGVWSLYEITSY